jgi:ribosome-binding protein aMBF1 (putative translation factor)
MSKNRYSTPEPQVPDCQDWTPVSMNKRRSAASTSSSASVSVLTNANASAYSSANSANSASAVVAAISKPVSTADDDTKKTKYIAKATSDAVRVSRCEKKLTQKELAQKCNMDVSIISEIERGGNCVYNASHINKIQSILGVKIPRA